MNKYGKIKISFVIFCIILLSVIGYGTFYVLNNLKSETFVFNHDGYALYTSKSNNFESKNYTFSNGTEYSYTKRNNNIIFKSDSGNVKIDDSTVIHYTDGSLLLLKNAVGIDLTTIDQKLIFYYNIYKNTNIAYSSGIYNIESISGEKINYRNLLLRIDENKYLFLGENIRLVLSDDNIVDFNNYVYFEFVDGSIVRLYNNNKKYQTIKKDSSIISGDLTINLTDKTIAKSGKKYITLSNLVIDSNNNIDVITESNVAALPKISKSNIVIKNEDEPINEQSGNNVVSGDETLEEGQQEVEEIEDPTKSKKTPKYKVSEIHVTPIQIDAIIEIEDEDSLLITDTKVTIVENSTLKTVYEQDILVGDTAGIISCAGLNPDTEYTLYAKAKYSISELEYEKNFISKIFRTEAIGIDFDKSYITTDKIVINISKEKYSSVSSAVVNILNSKNEKIDYKNIDLVNEKNVEVVFENLDHNSSYSISLTNIMCDGVVVQDGYYIKKDFKTLKEAPSVGKLDYVIDKKNALFELVVNNIEDPDLGIVEYRYEIYNVLQDIERDEPLLVLKSDNAKSVRAAIDGVKLERGSSYTYRLVIEFDDNEKIVEYTKDFSETMKMDGVEYPTIRFESTNVTWEQINGTIIIEDKSNAIVGDNYRVVYKNSVDSYLTNTFKATTSVNTIPIAINGLRANETYTFQVYADVNLQDNNPTIKEAYIGSVYVQTEKPKTLLASFENTNDYNSVFSVSTRLSSKEGESAALEASTISELTVTLYQGSNTKGSKEVYRKVIDLNDDDYESTIKEMLYDKNAIINPKFFDSTATNNDFHERTYTLELSNAYDYTKYKNEIPIENNTFTFQVNNYIPDLPADENSAISVTEIKNSASDVCNLEYNDKLDPVTTVCYILKTNYYDTAGNAKKMIYHTWIYNQSTKKYEMLSNLDKELEFNGSGEVEPLFVTLENGTSDSVFDNDTLRRGNNYYFSYEVLLDLDEDGEAESLYPSVIDPDKVLKSPILKPKKQTAKYTLYPSSTTSTSAKWNYSISDIDNALYEKKLFSFVGNKTTASSSPDIVLSNDYNKVNFSDLTNETFYAIKSNEKLLKSESSSYKLLSNQYLDNTISSLNLKYTTSIDSNSRLVVEINDYYNGDTSEIVDKVVSADVIIKPVGASAIEEKKFTNLTFENGKISINLVDIAEFINTEFSTDLIVYFDSGNSGFDVLSNYKSLQKVSIDGNGSYYYINSKGALAENSIIENSEFITNFDLSNRILNIKNKANKSLNLNITIDESGVIYNKNNITLKELKSQQLSPNILDEKITKFTILVPSIELYKNNKLNIIPLLTSVEVNANIKVADGINIQDNKVYVELYSTNENGTEQTYIKTIEKNISDFNNSVIIDELTPKSNYSIKFYTYVYDTESKQYIKLYLYDVDDKSVGRIYNFSTLADVGLKNLKVEFEPESYGSKRLNVSYTLESLFGYNHIEYKIYEKIDGEYKAVDKIEIPNSISFWNNMSFSIDASPGNLAEFSYGKEYKITASPIAYYDSNGTQKKVDLGTVEKEFTIPEYDEPQIGISSSKTDSSITFKVSIDDSSKIIKDGVYSIKLIDSKYDTITNETNISYKSINKEFVFDMNAYNLKDGETYSLVVSFDIDPLNDGKTFSLIHQQKSIKFGNSINLGSVTATKNSSSDYAINIIFSDPYLLNTVDKITYSVRSSSVYYFSTNTMDFTTIYDKTANIYTFVMPLNNDANFIPGNVYTITMNFYGKGVLLEQSEINYYYERG